MNRYFFRTALLLLSLPVMSCVGGGGIREKHRSLTEFNIEKSVKVIHGGNTGRNPTGKEILSAWGQPDHQETTASEQVWTYNTKPAMSGVMVFAYLPLPLGVPNGYDGIDFYFRNPATTPWRALERTTGISGGYMDAGGDSEGRKFHRLRD